MESIINWVNAVQVRVGKLNLPLRAGKGVTPVQNRIQCFSTCWVSAQTSSQGTLAHNIQGGKEVNSTSTSWPREDALMYSLIHLATDQWRLERRIERLEAASPDANLSGISDSAQRIGESLQELSVTTANHDGAIHDPGALYEVVHIRDECDTQVVVETIAPSVLINGKIVKHGQVVIGCERTEESGT